MLWGSSRPGRRAEEFSVADPHRGRSRPSRAEGWRAGRPRPQPRRTGPLPARARVARHRRHVKPGGRKARVQARVSPAPHGVPAPAGSRLARRRAARPLYRRASHARAAAPARAGDSNDPSAAGRGARGRGDPADPGCSAPRA